MAGRRGNAVRAVAAARSQRELASRLFCEIYVCGSQRVFDCQAEGITRERTFPTLLCAANRKPKFPSVKNVVI